MPATTVSEVKLPSNLISGEKERPTYRVVPTSRVGTI